MKLMPKLVRSLEFVVGRLKTTHYPLPTTYWRRRRLGFTLIELLVAITILGILATSTAVVYDNVRDKGRDNKRKQDLSAIKGALSLYFQDNGYYPCDTTPPNDCTKTSFVSSETQPWIPGLVSGSYIKNLPVDP